LLIEKINHRKNSIKETQNGEEKNTTTNKGIIFIFNKYIDHKNQLIKLRPASKNRKNSSVLTYPQNPFIKESKTKSSMTCMESISTSCENDNVSSVHKSGKY
jgi:hypothetical protein